MLTNVRQQHILHKTQRKPPRTHKIATNKQTKKQKPKKNPKNQKKNTKTKLDHMVAWLLTNQKPRLYYCISHSIATARMHVLVASSPGVQNQHVLEGFSLKELSRTCITD